VSPALIGTLSPTPPADGSVAGIEARLNQSFDRFTTDYLHAEGVYLSSGEPTADFTAYTSGRVKRLAHQLDRIFQQLPNSLDKIDDAHERGVTTVVNDHPFLHRVITGPAPPYSSSLLQTLNSASVVPPPGTRGAALSPYTLAATNAIQSARHSTINAVRYIIRV
jgi:hypothetical protein